MLRSRSLSAFLSLSISILRARCRLPDGKVESSTAAAAAALAPRSTAVCSINYSNLFPKTLFERALGGLRSQHDLGTYFENEAGRRALGDGTLPGGWMPVTVAMRAKVTTHLRLDVPVVHLHVHYLHELYPRG